MRSFFVLMMKFYSATALNDVTANELPYVVVEVAKVQSEWKIYSP